MSQPNSPFKFLDSYQKEDRDIFFGRDTEIDDLYEALSGVKHLLVYGPSGAGKTSLVECGLRNQFSDADWFALTIRRGSDINAAFFSVINEALTEKIEINNASGLPKDSSVNFGQAIETLFAERYQPVYLLFDQFEELLILGSDTEKKEFFDRLNQLIRYKVPCRVILIMREEFIGYLSEFEPLCPTIFQHRFRLEKMGRSNVRKVIFEMLNAPRYKLYFDVKGGEKLCEEILLKLPDTKHEIELAHVQVFLAELWERADKRKKKNEKPLLDAGLIEEKDNLQSVLDVFLKKQVSELAEIHGERVPLELLAAMISERNTKLQLTEMDLKKDLELKAVTFKQTLKELLKDLEDRRIIRTLKAGDTTQYEISHDILALLVGQNLTKEMKDREKARDIYELYKDRQNLFTAGDLDQLRPLQQYLPYPPAIQKRIKESEDNIKAIEQKELAGANKRLRILGGLLILAVLALVAAGYFGFNANRQKQDADNQKRLALEAKNQADSALINFQKEQEAKDSIQFDVLEGRANAIWPGGGNPIQIFEDMKRIASAHPDNQGMKEKIAFIKSKCPRCQ
jgi:hypothetical protein